jgi:hypothetical protein
MHGDKKEMKKGSGKISEKIFRNDDVCWYLHLAVVEGLVSASDPES